MHGEHEEDEKSGSGDGDERNFESWAEDFRAKQRAKYKDYHEEKYEKNERRFRGINKTSGKTLLIGIVAVAVVIAAAVMLLT